MLWNTRPCLACSRYLCRFRNFNFYVVGACFCGVTWSTWSQVHLVPCTLCQRPGAWCRVHCTRYLYRLPRSRNQRPGSSYQVLVAGTRDPATGNWYQLHGTSDQVRCPLPDTRCDCTLSLASVTRYPVSCTRYVVPGTWARYEVFYQIKCKVEIIHGLQEPLEWTSGSAFPFHKSCLPRYS